MSTKKLKVFSFPEGRYKKVLCVVILLVGLIIFLPSCTFFKIIYYNYSDIEDHKIFPHRPLKASETPFHFLKNQDGSRVPRQIRLNSHSYLLNDLLESNGTVAFLIVKNDILLFERYFQGYGPESITTAFSMTKSFLSALVGCAIDDGYIKSIEQPVTDFIPELAQNGFDKVKIRHLLQMTSGIDYTESDNPFGLHVWFYYGTNLEAKILKFKLKDRPGEKFDYKSGDNQLLGLILSRALKHRTLTQYMHERIWEPIGMEFDGSWSIDQKESGLEKTFCCLNGRARDYAKFGRLYLNGGNWNGKQIISKDWIEQSTKIDTSEGSVWGYQYQWWIVNKEQGDYMAAGNLGQYVYVNPKKDLIIVRLGKSRGSITSEGWRELFTNLAAQVS